MERSDTRCPCPKNKINQRAMKEGIRKTTAQARNWGQQAGWYQGAGSPRMFQMHRAAHVSSEPDQECWDEWQADGIDITVQCRPGTLPRRQWLRSTRKEKRWGHQAQLPKGRIPPTKEKRIRQARGSPKTLAKEEPLERHRRDTHTLLGGRGVCVRRRVRVLQSQAARLLLSLRQHGSPLRICKVPGKTNGGLETLAEIPEDMVGINKTMRLVIKHPPCRCGRQASSRVRMINLKIITMCSFSEQPMLSWRRNGCRATRKLRVPSSAGAWQPEGPPRNWSGAERVTHQASWVRTGGTMEAAHHSRRQIVLVESKHRVGRMGTTNVHIHGDRGCDGRTIGAH